MKQEIYSLVHLKKLKENTMFMKKLLCQRISKEATWLMILAIGFCFMCCKSDNRNIDCILQNDLVYFQPSSFKSMLQGTKDNSLPLAYS